MRLDKFVADQYPDLSRHFIKKLIQEGSIRVNEILREPDYQVGSSDSLQVDLPDISQAAEVGEDISLPIVHEDENIVVIDKPFGMVVHPARGHESGTLVNGLAYYFKKTGTPLSLPRVGIAHRLDKDTSGLILIAKNESTLGKLQNLFRDHRVEKEYLALVKGRPDEVAGEIARPIGRDPKHRLKFSVRLDGKEAITRFFTEKKFKDHTLLRLIPVTGRTHQLRVHLSSMGHPIVGDSIYGGEHSDRLFLHATKLSFKLDGKRRIFDSSLPDDLKGILKSLG